MNVLFLSPTFPNRYNPEYGIFSFQLVKNLQACDISVKVVAPVPYAPTVLWFKKKWREQGHIHQKECIDGVEIIYPRYPCLPGQKFIYWNTLFMCCSVYFVLKKLHHKIRFDLIHSYGVLPAGVVGQLIAGKLGLPSVCTAIGLDINMLSKISAGVGDLARRVLKNAGQVVAVGEDLKAEINNLYPPAKTVKVIYNGVDSVRFDLAGINSARARLELGYGPDVRMILFAGRLVREKGVYELMEVFEGVLQNFPEAVLVIIGEGNEKAALMNLTGEKGMRDRVIFRGGVPHEDMVWWYAASEVVILLSYYEGVPNVLKEAMSCGRAVVATRTVGITELVADGKTGILVEPGSVKQAVAALEKLLADPELSREMGVCARKLIQEKQLSWESTARAYQEVYLQQVRLFNH